MRKTRFSHCSRIDKAVVAADNGQMVVVAGDQDVGVTTAVITNAARGATRADDLAALRDY